MKFMAGLIDQAPFQCSKKKTARFFLSLGFYTFSVQAQKLFDNLKISIVCLLSLIINSSWISPVPIVRHIVKKQTVGFDHKTIYQNQWSAYNENTKSFENI